MNICYIVDHFYPHVGGVEKMTLGIARGILAKGHNVRVVTSDSGGVTGRRPYMGIDVYYYPWRPMFGHSLTRKGDLAEHVEWADIVHTTQLTAAVPALRVGRKFGKPVIVMIHEMHNHRWFWIEKNPIKAIVFLLFETYISTRKYTYWHTNSDATTRDLGKIGIKKNVKRVYPPVDFLEYDDAMDAREPKQGLREHFGIDADSTVFLFYGRPGQPKGLFVYLQAIRFLRDRHGKGLPEKVRFCFVMANDPIRQKNKFMRLVSKFNLGEYVLIKDPVEKKMLEQFIVAADFVVIPSIAEGFGYSAVEACHFGRNIIVSDGGSLPEVVFGRCLFFKNRDSDDLCEKLRQAILSEAEFTDIPRKEYRSDIVADELEELYLSLVG